MLSRGGAIARSCNMLLAAAASDGMGPSSSTPTASTTTAAAATPKKAGYAFFEDAYPKAKPPIRVATWEEQQGMATVKNLEPKKQLSESERLHKMHNWGRTEKGELLPEPSYGWATEWGPDPTEEGHNRFYEKPRQYMTADEAFRADMKLGVPLGKNEFRHQEMPYSNRMKAAHYNLAADKGQFFDTKTRGSWSEHSPEEKTDYVGKAKEEFQNEWLSKPGVTPDNMAMKMAEYNGTAKNKTVKSVDRVPEWELAPTKDFQDD